MKDKGFDLEYEKLLRGKRMGREDVSAYKETKLTDTWKGVFETGKLSLEK